MNIEDLLKSLHQEYLASLPSKIAIVESQIKAGGIGDLRESFHKLKGTGRTYGLPEVSELAELIEDICITHPVQALHAAAQAVPVLRDIFENRQKLKPYNFAQDPRVALIRKLLQN